MTILHFFWQGAALAAIAAAAMEFSRRATTQYAIAVVILVLMAAAPVLTFTVLRHPDSAANLTGQIPVYRTSAANSPAAEFSGAAGSSGHRNPASSDYLSWLVYAWLAGVILLSLRPAVGFVALHRLRLNLSMPVSDAVRERCLSLQKSLGIRRLIRYCECLHLEAPAVAGWFRPVVLLPLSAVTGLSADQLDAVIAHELAHIRRLDAFVNLFQIAAEILLFFHPAVWWLSKRIRAERENCCDDVAIAVCGNAAAYARALASMAERPSVPVLAMAANRGPLSARVARILGLAKARSRIRGASLGASMLCLSASLLAGHALFGAGRTPTITTPGQSASSAAATSDHPDDAIIAITPATPLSAPAALGQPLPQPKATPAPEPIVQDDSAQENAAAAKNAGSPSNAPSGAKSSYIDGLKSVGLDNLSIDQLIALKIQGVTPEYVRALHEAGLQPDVDQIVAMKIQGMTPEYVKELRDLGLKSDIDNVIAMKIQGVTAAYVRELRAAFPQITSDNIVAMKIQGVTPDYPHELHDASGLNLDAGDIIGMKIQGVSPEYIRDLKALGLKLDAGDIIGMKIQGITPAYVKAMQSAGLRFDSGEIIAAKIQGVTPEFIERVRQHGFHDLDLGKLIQLKQTGVLDQ
jgi:beta-lactamase regulating signal transducer with metallopeptidase domain